MRRTAGLLLFLSCMIARGEIPKAGPLAQPKRADQAGLPRELTAAVTPRDNATTPEKVALGQKLFFDGRLSADGTVACATCHDPVKGFTDGKPTSVGIGKQVGHRNAPTVLDALYNDTQFWDGRARTLEDQAKLPITNKIEMGMPSLERRRRQRRQVPEYEAAFQRVFGRPINGDDLGARARRVRAHAGRVRLAVRSLPRRRRERDGRRGAPRLGARSTAAAAACRVTASTARARPSATISSTTSASPRTSRTSWSWRARACSSSIRAIRAPSTTRRCRPT